MTRAATSRAGVGRADALDAPVVLVLAALQPAALKQRLDGAAGARKRHAEALGELLDRELAGAAVDGVERLDLGDREVELLEQADERPARVLHHDLPELEQLAGECGGGDVLGDGRRGGIYFH